jgi:hypothetical protein
VIYANGGWIRIDDLGLRWRLGADECLAGQAIARKAARGVLSLRQREALEIAAARGAVRRRDVVARCGISSETGRRELAALVERGFLFQGWRWPRCSVHTEIRC